jgi:hypothetical protein
MGSFRDSTILTIETGRTVVRAGLGIHELLKTPAVVSRRYFRQPSILTRLMDTGDTCTRRSETDSGGILINCH